MSGMAGMGTELTGTYLATNRDVGDLGLATIDVLGTLSVEELRKQG